MNSVWLISVLAGVLTGGGVKPADYKPELRPSTYTPTKQRDPFGWSGGETVKGTNLTVVTPASLPVAFPFRLEGIQYDSRQPSAIVNNQLVVLKKPVVLRAGNEAVQVRAVEITADKVILEAGGRRVELRLAKPSPTQ